MKHWGGMWCRSSVRWGKCLIASLFTLASASLLATEADNRATMALPPSFRQFTDNYCSDCHDDMDFKGRLDFAALSFNLDDPAVFGRWVKVHDRLQAGEMPPKQKKHRPDDDELGGFLDTLREALNAHDRQLVAQEGRAVQRRLNSYEYENALRDLLSAPWLQIRGQFPEDGESQRFNKVGSALDVSQVQMARYLAAANYALRQVLSAQFVRPPTTTTRYYARDQSSLTQLLKPRAKNNSPDRSTYPVLGTTTTQTDVRLGLAPITVGESDPETRELEGVGWVASHYVTGFSYRWNQFHAPVAGKYRIRFNGFTQKVGPGGAPNTPGGSGRPGRPGNPKFPDFDKLFPGERDEPISVYTENGIMNRRVGTFDLTLTPAVHDIGEIWLLANETLLPDATRLFRSRPGWDRNPLMTPEGAPSVVFRWMEVEGPIYEEPEFTGYRQLFADLPIRKAKAGESGIAIPIAKSGKAADEVVVVVVSGSPRPDAERLLRSFLAHAYRRPVTEVEVDHFLALFDERTKAGLGFGEALLVTYTAVLAAPGFVFLEEQPGRLDDYALATRLALFLWNSPPDAALRARAANGELHQPDVLRAETERLLADERSSRFREAFLDYWIDLRKIWDATPSTSLYNDYYLDDALTEAAVDETRLTFAELIRADLPARNIAAADFTYLNERLAKHYAIPGVQGVAMRRVTLPASSPRGGFLTQASVLKITANGTTTSPVLRGKWILERILGIDIPPPPPVGAVEPDIRGAVTIRQQLEKHRDNSSCAAFHRKMDPPGFALENFDVMGGWRDRYRGIDESKTPEVGIGKNGHRYGFHFGLPVDAAGELPDGRPFQDIREFKRLLQQDDQALARNLVQQLLIYGTGAPVRFSDRPEIEKIFARASSSHYGVRSLIHEIVQSDIFLSK